MATKRRRGKTWQYIVKRSGLLPKPLHLTFDTEAEGDAYVAKLEALLDKGIVPPDFQESTSGDRYRTIHDLVRAYTTAVSISETDEGVLGVIRERVGSVPLTKAGTYDWAEHWVTTMKRERQMSPVTIRHHVGALARCFDWAGRKGVTVVAINPLRQLPRGYATYTEEDRRALGEEEAPEEEYRDRRLDDPKEEEAIREILDGVKPEGRQRPMDLPWQGALECLFDLAIESAMRMREMYTLDLKQVDLKQRTVFLEKTKNGNKRQVPLSSVAVEKITGYMAQVEKKERGMEGFSFEGGRLFPWWDGNTDSLTLRRVTSKLSRQYKRIFEAAGAEGLGFHDLRHEATSRLFERTDLSDLEIASITGHKDPRVLKRYANLRASKLAGRLW